MPGPVSLLRLCVFQGDSHHDLRPGVGRMDYFSRNAGTLVERSKSQLNLSQFVPLEILDFRHAMPSRRFRTDEDEFRSMRVNRSRIASSAITRGCPSHAVLSVSTLRVMTNCAAVDFRGNELRGLVAALTFESVFGFYQTPARRVADGAPRGQTLRERQS